MKVFDVTAQNGVTLASGLTLREANALALRIGAARRVTEKASPGSGCIAGNYA